MDSSPFYYLSRHLIFLAGGHRAGRLGDAHRTQDGRAAQPAAAAGLLRAAGCWSSCRAWAAASTAHGAGSTSASPSSRRSKRSRCSTSCGCPATWCASATKSTRRGRRCSSRWAWPVALVGAAAAAAGLRLVHAAAGDHRRHARAGRGATCRACRCRWCSACRCCAFSRSSNRTACAASPPSWIRGRTSSAPATSCPTR